MESSNNGQYYIIDVDNPKEQLQFQFIPFEIKHNSSGKNSTVEIVGRSHPKRHYLSGDEGLSLQLDFHATGDEIGTVKDKVFWLVALKGKDIKLIYGNLYQNIVWVIERLDITWREQDLERGLPQIASVNVSLAINAQRSITTEQIRNNQW
jgi:hypothetical protein